MAKNRINNEGKNAELAKYRDLVIATLDYLIENSVGAMKTADFDPIAHFESLKTQTAQHFQKGRLSKLKHWFHDLAEPYREIGDLKFTIYLKTKTGQDIDIYQDLYARVEKIVTKGKITTDNQFYDVNLLVDQLSQSIPVDNDKLAKLNSLLADYERRRTRNKRKD